MTTGESRADYFEHGADIGIIGRGATVERAFEAAARAMFAIVADSAAVGRDAEADIAFDESDLDLALVQWLNALLAAAREQGAVWAEFALTREGDCWRGQARGARWKANDARGVEVKGATLTALSVRRDADGWDARCVVDV